MNAVLRFADTTPTGRPLLPASAKTRLDVIQKATGSRPTVSVCVVSIATHPESAVTDPVPTARLDGGAVVTGEVASQFFVTGLVNADYILTFLFTLSNGEKWPVNGIISVRTFLGL